MEYCSFEGVLFISILNSLYAKKIERVRPAMSSLMETGWPTLPGKYKKVGLAGMAMR